VIGDAVVFDGVAHPFNFDADNAFGAAGQMFSNHLYAFHATLTPDSETVMAADAFLHKWSIDEIRDMVYEQSDTDLLVAMPLPLTDLYKDGLSPWEECARLAQLDPDRTVFWGTVNPLEGRRALDDVTRQVEEFGAKAFKFYNVR
jgi:predicted TIM-barrel fold metal-dependent hydrolase